MLSALNFYASGSYQRRVGQDSLSCVSQTIVSRKLKEITALIVNNLFPLYVCFPIDEEAMVENQNRYFFLVVDFYRLHSNLFIFFYRFFMETGYPNVIGIIDGTHVGLSAVPLEVENGYINHKGFHSLNVQVVRFIFFFIKDFFHYFYIFTYL